MRLNLVSSVKSNSDSSKDSTTVASVAPLYALNAPNTSSRCRSSHTIREWECAETAWKNSTRKGKNKKSERGWSPKISAGGETWIRVNSSSVRNRETRRCHPDSLGTRSSRSSPTWTHSWWTQVKTEISSIQSRDRHSSIVIIEVRTLHPLKLEARASQKTIEQRMSKTGQARGIAQLMRSVDQLQVQTTPQETMSAHQSSGRFHRKRHALVLDVFSTIRKRSNLKRTSSTESLKQE